MESQWPAARAQKFRQAAFAYLHVAVLYEAAAYIMWQENALPTDRGPPVLWMVLGAIVATIVVWGLYGLKNVWVARVVWALHGLRLPALIRGAFFTTDGAIAPAFYLTAIVVVVVNLWMLARAGWDV